MGTDNRCDIAHRQGVILPDFHIDKSGWHFTPMTDGFDIKAVRETLNRLMRAKDIKRKPLAKQAGLGETAIRDIFDEKRNDVRASTLVKLAEFFDVSMDELVGAGPVPLVGKIGAGGVVLFEEYDEPEMMPRPPLGMGPLIALEVVGSSMLPKYEAGDVIYIRRDHDGVLPEYLNEYCAVRTSDGGTYIKILTPGTQSDRYTLRSLNAEDMTDVEVLWASPV